MAATDSRAADRMESKPKAKEDVGAVGLSAIGGDS